MGIFGGRDPNAPDKYAALARRNGQTIYTKTLPAGVLKPDRAIMKIEAAGWRLEHREESVRGRRRVVVLTFRAVESGNVEA